MALDFVKIELKLFGWYSCIEEWKSINYQNVVSVICYSTNSSVVGNTFLFYLSYLYNFLSTMATLLVISLMLL